MPVLCRAAALLLGAAVLLAIGFSDAPPDARSAEPIRIVRGPLVPASAITGRVTAGGRVETVQAPSASMAVSGTLSGDPDPAEEAWQEAAQTAARSRDPYRIEGSVLAEKCCGTD